MDFYWDSWWWKFCWALMDDIERCYLYRNVSKLIQVFDVTSQVAPVNQQETQETWVWSLGLEDPLEEGMATHSNILIWRIPWTEEPGGLQSMESQRVGHDWWTTCAHTHTHTHTHTHRLPRTVLKNHLIVSVSGHPSIPDCPLAPGGRMFYLFFNKHCILHKIVHF